MLLKKIFATSVIAFLITTNAIAAPAKGKFIVRYYEPESPDFTQLHQAFSGAHFLEEFANVLNESFALPKSIALTTAECGTSNAFFDPEKNAVTLCYELIADFAQQAAAMNLNQKESESYIAGSLIFVFLHEIGHALTSVLDLPITGKEEDAVDQLATYVLLESAQDDKQFEDNAQLIANASMWFANISSGTYEAAAFADEHSLGEQRFYNVLCWMYGADPASFDDFVTNGTLPETRAARCPGEYQQLSASWGKLLEPYSKE